MSEAHGQQLPPGWATATLADLVGFDGLFCDGDWVESKDQDPFGDIRLIQLADVGDGDYRDRSKRFLTASKAAELRCTFIKEGDLLLARMPDPLGRVCVFPGDSKPSVTVVDVCIIRLASAASSRWLMHQLNTPQIRRTVSELQSGTTRKRISRANLAKVSFPVPPLTEQGRIADKLEELLSDLDAGVAALERVKAKLKHYRAAVLKAAVEGTLTADWREKHPGTEPASELRKRILDERRRRWEEAQLQKFKEACKEPPKDWKAKYQEPVAPIAEGLPVLPQGWCWVTLDQLSILVTSGSRGWAEYYSETGPLFVRSQDIRTDRLVLADVAHVTPPKSSEGARTRLHQGDFLVTITGANVAKAALVDCDLDEAYISQHVGMVRFVEARLGAFVHIFATAPSGGRKVLLKVAYGAGKPGLNLDNLRGLLVPTPPLAEQEAIVETVDDQLSVIDHLETDLEAKLKSAHALRQSILRHAFTGQLVPQDLKDESAAELLKRIAAQREELARQAQAANKTKPKVTAKRAAKRTRAKHSHD